MFKTYEPVTCANHKDRVAEFVEDQSGLHFCHLCRDSLKSASKHELFLMTHAEEKVSPKESEPAKSVEKVELAPFPPNPRFPPPKLEEVKPKYPNFGTKEE